MKKQIKTMEQLKDSQLLFEKKLPPFGGILLIIVTVSLIGVLIWSMYTHKNHMILSKGTVTDKNANYVMTAYAGVIEECHMTEGMLVESGDVLFTIKSTDYNLQEEQLLLNQKFYEEKIEKLELLVKSVKDDVNHFEVSKAEDSFYYSTYEAYQSQIKQNTFDATTYKLYGYSDAQIQAEIEKNSGKLSEIYYTTLQSIESSIQETRQADTQIEAYVSIADMARMQEDDSVQIAVGRAIMTGITRVSKESILG